MTMVTLQGSALRIWSKSLVVVGCPQVLLETGLIRLTSAEDGRRRQMMVMMVKRRKRKIARRMSCWKKQERRSCLS